MAYRLVRAEWTITRKSAYILPVGYLGTNFSQIWINTIIFYQENPIENFCQMAGHLMLRCCWIDF